MIHFFPLDLPDLKAFFMKSNENKTVYHFKKKKYALQCDDKDNLEIEANKYFEISEYIYHDQINK